MDGRTKRSVCVFEVLFKGVSTSFGLPLIENSFKNAYAKLCSAVQNLRLGSINLLQKKHQTNGRILMVNLIVANKKVARSALGENLHRKVVKKVDNAKITTYATI